MMPKKKNQSNFVEKINILQSIGSDLKGSIDDLIHQVEIIKDDVDKLKKDKVSQEKISA